MYFKFLQFYNFIQIIKIYFKNKIFYLLHKNFLLKTGLLWAKRAWNFWLLYFFKCIINLLYNFFVKIVLHEGRICWVNVL